MASHNPNKDKKCVVLALPAYPFKPQKERSRTTKKKEVPSNNSDNGVFSGPSGIFIHLYEPFFIEYIGKMKIRYECVIF